MDAVGNPFAPGAGTAPPELAGRAATLRGADVRLRRLLAGRSANSLVMVGLRGVGKTVLLRRMCSVAENHRIHAANIEVPEDRSLASLLVPQIRISLLRLNKGEQVKRALRALAGFVTKLRVRYNDIEVGLDAEPEPGLADSGDLEADLTALLLEAGRAAKTGSTALVFFIDELQYVEQPQLAALIAGLHRCAQDRLPVGVVGAGLPQLRAIVGEAKTYAERLFDFIEIGALGENDAREAIVKPIRGEGANIEETAVNSIIAKTQGYPYFLQEWGKYAWDVANGETITSADVGHASRLALAALDAGFFRVRFDRLTPAERLYLRAMASLGPNVHRSGEVAAVLKRSVQSLGPTRAQLIHKGMAWSPAHGDVAFTVPLFDQFMKRIMPGDDWKE